MKLHTRFVGTHFVLTVNTQEVRILLRLLISRFPLFRVQDNDTVDLNTRNRTSPYIFRRHAESFTNYIIRIFTLLNYCVHHLSLSPSSDHTMLIADDFEDRGAKLCKLNASELKSAFLLLILPLYENLVHLLQLCNSLYRPLV